jgi:hypothetical protein
VGRSPGTRPPRDILEVGRDGGDGCYWALGARVDCVYGSGRDDVEVDGLAGPKVLLSDCQSFLS